MSSLSVNVIKGRKRMDEASANIRKTSASPGLMFLMSCHVICHFRVYWISLNCLNKCE